MCTLTFIKEVLKGEKKLLKMHDIAGIPKIPKIPEINASAIWNDIKQDKTIRLYFPNSYVNSNRTPDRSFMFTVSS
jgi:hypothetical protein